MQGGIGRFPPRVAPREVPFPESTCSLVRGIFCSFPALTPVLNSSQQHQTVAHIPFIDELPFFLTQPEALALLEAKNPSDAINRILKAKNSESSQLQTQLMLQLQIKPESEGTSIVSCSSNKVSIKLLSPVGHFVTPWTVAYQAPLSTGILQARILEWVAMPSSRGSSPSRDRTRSPAVQADSLPPEPPGMSESNSKIRELCTVRLAMRL